MKKLFAVLALTSLLWLEGCYYSGNVSTENNYYEDPPNYYPPVTDPAPPQPIVIVVPQPYPVYVPGNPPSAPVKYRPGSTTGDRNTSTNPDAYRNSNRNTDMTSVKVNREPISSQPAQKPEVTSNRNDNKTRDTNAGTRNANTNNSKRGSDGERAR